MDETVRRLHDEVEEGLFTRGVQIAIAVDGEEVLDLALGDDGLGRSMEPSTLLRIYCAIKPVTALAVGRLADDGALELDAPLHHRLPRYACLSEETTLRHVLDHTAGLHNPPAFVAELVPPADRIRYLERVPEASGWRMGKEAAYSEHLGWHLLGRLIEEVTRTPVRDHLRRHLLDPLGLDTTFIGMTDDQVAGVLPRLGVNVDMRTDQGYPMLFERTERVLREANCAHGGYTTASDLCRLYAQILRARTERVDPHLPEPATLTTMTSTGRRAFDPVLDRECGWGLGFMTDLAEHHFGRDCGPRSFGHSGYSGSSLAFADPDHDLAVAILFNGVVDHESAFLRRPALIGSIYRDLGLVAPPAVEDTQEATRSRRWRRR